MDEELPATAHRVVRRVPAPAEVAALALKNSYNYATTTHTVPAPAAGWTSM
jgi:hypothetical protein